MKRRHRINAVSLAVLWLAGGGAVAQIAPALPDALTSRGDVPVMTISATGVQVYECRANAGGAPEWVFKEPRAELFLDGRKVGRHYAGPTWEHEDGSLIRGKVAARMDAPRAGDIPWLRLDVASSEGVGVFGGIAVVQRINTRGGALAGACPTIGQVSERPYTSDYVMVRRSP
jgi:hypothetical protein